MDKKSQTKISKLLSLALRHDPTALSLTLDSNGWAKISDVIKGIKSKGHSCNIEDLYAVVMDNDKQRFSINAIGTMIRANQGHSIAVDLELVACTPPDILYHGTSSHSTEAIYKTGIQKMSRQHTHLSADTETATKVGSRHGGKLVIFQVDAKAMSAAGHDFFKSENGVWLTDHVPVEFLLRL